MDNQEINNSEDKREKNDEKMISSIISGKILDYKTKLDAFPVQLIPIDQSEQDRKEVNNLYNQIVSPATQILDSKFYIQILKMNRERDKNFLKEGTTRKERIAILSQLMTRVTTPILFLNHKRNILLSNFIVFGNDKQPQSKEIKKEVYEEPITNFSIPEELTPLEIADLRNNVLNKTENKSWDYNAKPNLDLTDWEADILSQLIRNDEIRIIFDSTTRRIKIVRNTEKIKNTRIISFLIEPERKNLEK